MFIGIESTKLRSNFLDLIGCVCVFFFFAVAIVSWSRADFYFLELFWPSKWAECGWRLQPTWSRLTGGRMTLVTRIYVGCVWVSHSTQWIDQTFTTTWCVTYAIHFFKSHIVPRHAYQLNQSKKIDVLYLTLKK